MINRRCAEILSDLTAANRPVRVADLSEKYGVSQRTIHNDIAKIDSYLHENGLESVKRKPGSGLWCSFTKTDLTKLRQKLDSIGFYQYVMTIEERVRFIIMTMLKNSNYETVADLSEELKVSKGTVHKDLKQVRLWLKEHNLELDIHKAHGVKVLGDEEGIRRAYMKLVDTPQERIDYFCVNGIFSRQDIIYIKQCLKKAEEHLELVFTDETFQSLSAYLGIAVFRNRQGKKLDLHQKNIDMLKDKEEFSVAELIAYMIKGRFSIQLAEDEIAYLAMFLLTGNVIINRRPDKENWVQWRIDVSELINHFQEEVSVNLSNDEQLFEGLLQHYRPMIYRAKYQIKITNPYLAEIKNSIAGTFQKTRSCLRPIEYQYGIQLSDDEIGYLALYFQTALEKVRREAPRKSALIVCESGIGTAKIVQLRLQELYDVNIIDTIPARALKKTLKSVAVDCVVSTIQIQAKGIRCIVVDPFISDADMVELDRYLPKKRAFSLQAKGDIDLGSLIRTIEKSAVIFDRNKLEMHLHQLLTRSGPSGDALNLTDVFQTDDISLNVEAETWEDAVRQGGELLLRKGKIEPGYIDDTIRNVKKFGPYIVILPGIALPHVNSFKLVHATGFSLITLKKAIPFGNGENDPVHLVISFCSVDQFQHMKALSQLMQIIKRKDFLEFARSVKTRSELMNYFITSIFGTPDNFM
ncbi:hypothetical protein A7X67_13375 [Clostridium sp. W14A]|nr:hypothetical protein A7X67_13375 [Clostridium sp. W14A]